MCACALGAVRVFFLRIGVAQQGEKARLRRSLVALPYFGAVRGRIRSAGEVRGSRVRARVDGGGVRWPRSTCDGGGGNSWPSAERRYAVAVRRRSAVGATCPIRGGDGAPWRRSAVAAWSWPTTLRSWRRRCSSTVRVGGGAPLVLCSARSTSRSCRPVELRGCLATEQLFGVEASFACVESCRRSGGLPR